MQLMELAMTIHYHMDREKSNLIPLGICAFLFLAQFRYSTTDFHPLMFV